MLAQMEVCVDKLPKASKTFPNYQTITIAFGSFGLYFSLSHCSLISFFHFNVVGSFPPLLHSDSSDPFFLFEFALPPFFLSFLSVLARATKHFRTNIDVEITIVRKNFETYESFVG